MAANRTILILEGLPMAHLKAYVPNFPKHMRKRSQSLKLWVLALSEVRWSRIVSTKIAVFKAFFERKCSLTAKPSTLDPIVLYIIRKLSIRAFWKFRLKVNFGHPMKRHFLGTPPDRILTSILHCVLRPVEDWETCWGIVVLAICLWKGVTPLAWVHLCSLGRLQKKYGIKWEFFAK